MNDDENPMTSYSEDNWIRDPVTGDLVFTWRKKGVDALRGTQYHVVPAWSKVPSSPDDGVQKPIHVRTVCLIVGINASKYVTVYLWVPETRWVVVKREHLRFIHRVNDRMWDDGSTWDS